MEYINEFKELLKQHPFSYIGTGNPNSKILIIGKECAIDPDKEAQRHHIEVLNNPKDWVSNIEKKLNPEDIDNWFTTRCPKYNPLYPYKGQLAKRYTKDALGVENKGTSTTWVKYQKLIDLIIRPDNHRSGSINFHEDSFITELSDVPGKYSSHVKDKDKRNSILQRSELLESSFFQQFPIVIVACGMDIRNYSINLEKIFNVKFQPATHFIRNIRSNWYNIHFGIGKHPKILIHTNQLSMSISNQLLYEIAKHCKEFSIENQIKIHE